MGHDDMEALAVGAALMGGGGGGSTAAATVIAERALRLSGPLLVLEARELPPDSVAVPLGLIGSVTVFEEKPAAGTEAVRAIRALERYTGVRIGSVLAFEAAGVNALIPVIAAATLGLPLVDADGMGRAFPQLDQTVFTLHNLPVSPMVLADEKETVELLDGVDPSLAEHLARSSVVAMGGWALLAFAPQRAPDLVTCAIPGTIGKALALGRDLRRGDLRSIFAHHGGCRLFRGRVVEVERHPHGSFGGGSAVLQHREDHQRFARLEFQNENLLLIEDGDVRASVPDMICLLHPGHGLPLTSEDLRFGLELEAVALPCAPAWRTPAGLDLVGPRAFGYDVPYSRPRADS
jgi:DUF917 family protein